MRWVDAPLSGGAQVALQRTLALMVGGNPEDVVAARPVLDCPAARITHMGAAPARQTFKLVNQILGALNFLTVAEAARFAEANGIGAAASPKALAGGLTHSPGVRAKMVRRDINPTGRIDNVLKDLETREASAPALRVPLPLTSLVADLHGMLVTGGLAAAGGAEYMRLFDPGRDVR